MGYDLRLRPRDGVLTEARFVEAFETRTHWSLPEEDVAAYANPATAVSFHVTHVPPAVVEPTGALVFSINFHRHRGFVLEADLVLRELVDELDLAVEDVQTDGIVGDDYDSDAFLRGWSLGNRAAYAAAGADPEVEPPLTYPGEMIERVWRWNHEREATEAEHGGYYLARLVGFALAEGRVQTFTEWRLGANVLLPRAELVAIRRDQTSGAVVPWDRVAGAIELRDDDRVDEPLDYWALLDAVVAPKASMLVQPREPGAELTMLDPGEIHAIEDVTPRRAG